MSSALVRQALDFVDPDESSGKRKNRGGARHQSSSGQDQNLLQKKNKKSKHSNSKKKKKSAEKDDQVTQEVVSRLLKLSKPTLDKKIAKKIVKRAATGKPVADKIKIKTEEQKSILFPDDDFKKFEREPFCS